MICDACVELAEPMKGARDIRNAKAAGVPRNSPSLDTSSTATINIEDVPYSNKVLSLAQIRRIKNLLAKPARKAARTEEIKNALRMDRAQEEIERRVLGHLDERLKGAAITEAMTHTILGDEYLVRLELDLRIQPVDERCLVTGHTLLTQAASRDHFHIVQMLLRDFEADPCIPTLLGLTSPLHLAVSRGNRKIAALLLTFGADPEQTDKYNNTPLHLVTCIGVLRLLLKYSVNLCAKNLAGLTPLEHFLRNTDSDKAETSDIGRLLADCTREAQSMRKCKIIESGTHITHKKLEVVK